MSVLLENQLPAAKQSDSYRDLILDEMRTDFDRYFYAAMDTLYDQRGHLGEAIRYSLFCGGKRLRPLLAMAAADIYGRSAAIGKVCGAALEMIHTYSLIHDDLPAMDDDDLRRGHPTNHKVYGEAMAILAGDGLLSDAIAFFTSGLLAQGVKAETIVTMQTWLFDAIGSQGMVHGQVLDIQADQALGLAHLQEIHRNKTGKLIRVALCLGAGNDNAELDRIGKSLGLAFQIIDDIKDLRCDVHALGKTPGKDLDQAKFTYPGLLGIERAIGEAARTLDACQDHIAQLGSGKGCRVLLAIVAKLRRDIT